MKRLMFILALVLPLVAQADRKIDQDTLVVQKPTKVTIITGDSIQSIIVQGKEGNPAYVYQNSIRLVDSNYVSTSKIDNDWNFSFGPFGRQSDKKPPLLECTTNFFVGFNSAPGLPQSADLHPFSSWELWWLIADMNLFPWNNDHSFSVGFGIDWRNYRIKGDTRFDKQDNGRIAITGYPEGASPKFSRIKVFSLTVPVRYHFDTKNFGFSLGPVINFNTYSSLKTKWKVDGKEMKDIEKKAGVRPVTVDFMATVRGFGTKFYFKYSPCDLLKDETGLKFKTLSFGVYL